MPTPAEQEATMVANLEARTGRTLEEWIELVRASGLSKHSELVGLLKTEHGLGHGYANLVVHRAAGAADDPVAAQYAGPKAGLREIYDAILAAARGFGEVEVAPKKSYVSLRRAKQFALVQPSTASRLDLGINLRGVEPEGRLEASGSFNSMVTHRVRLTSAAELDAEVVGWLRRAWEQAG
jgi:Domain of unknown function (DUF4287)/Domain of unknown function (DUF5655)